MLPHFSGMYVNQTLAGSGGDGDVLFATITYDDGGVSSFSGAGTTEPSNATELAEYGDAQMIGDAGGDAQWSTGSYIVVGGQNYYYDGDDWVQDDDGAP